MITTQPECMVINAQGDFVSQFSEQWDATRIAVVFLRRDGWTLGAPAELVRVAYERCHPNEWTAVRHAASDCMYSLGEGHDEEVLQAVGILCPVTSPPSDICQITGQSHARIVWPGLIGCGVGGRDVHVCVNCGMQNGGEGLWVPEGSFQRRRSS